VGPAGEGDAPRWDTGTPRPPASGDGCLPSPRPAPYRCVRAAVAELGLGLIQGQAAAAVAEHRSLRGGRREGAVLGGAAGQRGGIRESGGHQGGRGTSGISLEGGRMGGVDSKEGVWGHREVWALGVPPGLEGWGTPVGSEEGDWGHWGHQRALGTSGFSLRTGQGTPTGSKEGCWGHLGTPESTWDIRFCPEDRTGDTSGQQRGGLGTPGRMGP